MSAVVKRPPRHGRGTGSTFPSFTVPLGSGIASPPDWRGGSEEGRFNGRTIRAFGTYVPIWTRPPSGVPIPLARKIVDPDAEQGWAVVLGDLDDWERLPDDWDGEGGRALRREVIEAGRTVARALSRVGAPVPEHYVAGDGEIGFRWRSENGFASVSLLEDGNVLVYMHSGDRVLHNRDEAWTSETDLSGLAGDLAKLA